MKVEAIGALLSLLLKALPREVVVKALDGMLDVIESSVERSESRVDDALVLPLIGFIRRVGNIPDND